MRAFIKTSVVSTLLARGARVAKQRRHAATKAASRDGRDLVEIIPESREQLDRFLSMSEFSRADSETLSPEQILVWTTEETRSALEQAGLKYTPAADPNEVRSLSSYTYTSGNQDWGQYCEYDCMTSRLQDIAATCGYPLESIGKSVNGREIWAMTIGSGAPEVLMAGGIHGDETTGVQMLQRWMWETCFEPSAEQAAIAQSAVAYIPMLNPDGYESIRRNNAANRDLNRDFPAPGESDSTAGKQPETVAWMNYVSGLPSLKVSSMMHGGVIVNNYGYDACYSNLPGELPCGGNNRPPALLPGDDDAWAQELARAYNFPPSYSCLYPSCITNGASWYEIYGSQQDYDVYFKGIMSVTLEVSATKRPSASSLPTFYTDQYAAIVNFIQLGKRGRPGPTPAPLPTPAPPPGSWELSGSGCEMSGDCISSLNYPSSYGNNEACTVTLSGNVALSVEAFSTESGYDFLTMGGSSYSGSNGPSSGTYSGSIDWGTDGSVTNSGWRVCKS